MAGWDARDGGSVYGVPLGGMLVKLPFTLGAAPSLQHIACDARALVSSAEGVPCLWRHAMVNRSAGCLAGAVPLRGAAKHDRICRFKLQLLPVQSPLEAAPLASAPQLSTAAICSREIMGCHHGHASAPDSADSASESTLPGRKHQSVLIKVFENCVRASRWLGLSLHLRLLRQELETRHERGRLPCVCGEGCVACDGARRQLGRCAAAVAAS